MLSAAAFTGRLPGVDIRLAAGPKQALLTELKAEALDLAVIAGRTDDEGIEILSLWSEQILLIVRDTHPFASRAYADWMDLSDERILISRRGLGPELKEILTAKVAVLGKPPITEEHAIGAEALLSLVAADRGVSLHCEGTITAPPVGLAMLEVHDGMGPSWLTYSVCWKKQHINPALPSFLALLRAHRSLLSSGRIPDT